MNQFNTAFEVTVEDLNNVISNKGRIATESELNDLMNLLDLEQVTAAALYYDDLEDQTNAAMEEIYLQLSDEIQKLMKIY